MTTSRINNSTRVRVEFDLRQSIDARGYKQPDEATFRAMQRAFEDCLWYEIEEHWADIVSYTGFDFAEDPSQERSLPNGNGSASNAKRFGRENLRKLLKFRIMW